MDVAKLCRALASVYSSLIEVETVKQDAGGSCVVFRFLLIRV